MKTLIRITIFVLLLILLLGIKGAKAHDEYTKVIKKEIPIPADGQLVINNKFGKVHCNNWDKNAVSFEITVTVEAASDKSAAKLLDQIDFIFNISPSSVEAKTKFGENGNHGKSSMKIDYLVYMPVGINLTLENKFGDIFINEIMGKTKIDLGYGNLEINKLGNSDNMLEIEFSKANVNWMKGAVVILKYSGMDIKYAGSLYLDSKFSNLDAGNIISMNMTFEGGALNMVTSSTVKSKSKFSDLDIGRLEKNLNLDIQYGSCKIHEMPTDFTSVIVNNKFGNVSIGLDGKANYQLDAELKFCDLDYSSEAAKFSYRAISPTEKVLRGVIGEGNENPSAKVQVRSEYGNISLK